MIKSRFCLGYKIEPLIIFQNDGPVGNIMPQWGGNLEAAGEFEIEFNFAIRFTFLDKFSLYIGVYRHVVVNGFFRFVDFEQVV